jgi:4-aminobutyrate aminotransferase
MLELLEKEGLTERSRILGDTLLSGLLEGLRDVSHVGEVRGSGLFVGVELVEPGGVDPMVGGAVRVVAEALRRGILLLPAGAQGHVVEFSPPLVLTEEQMAWAVPELVGMVRGLSA